jgi:hypothetical protein
VRAGTLFYPGRPDKIGGSEHIPASSPPPDSDPLKLFLGSKKYSSCRSLNALYNIFLGTQNNSWVPESRAQVSSLRLTMIREGNEVLPSTSGAHGTRSQMWCM